uniref:C-type lectin domain-containing protein n=1 Tax=Panagrolaimus sp. ES5 TaxID=591445 RepID=A0AC34FX53_9BILA
MVRGYWGVTHVCEWTWKGSFAASIHCQEENDWTFSTYKGFFLGLYIPEGIPWAPHHFRWTDGTPFDYNDWCPPFPGSPNQQPHNEVPTERVVDNSGHWHDTISNNPVTHRILCKMAPEKINYFPPKNPSSSTKPPKQICKI